MVNKWFEPKMHYSAMCMRSVCKHIHNLKSNYAQRVRRIGRIHNHIYYRFCIIYGMGSIIINWSCDEHSLSMIWKGLYNYCEWKPIPLCYISINHCDVWMDNKWLCGQCCFVHLLTTWLGCFVTFIFPLM